MSRTTCLRGAGACVWSMSGRESGTRVYAGHRARVVGAGGEPHSRLTGCGEFGDVRIVAVLNGVPRWYANGEPINESRGTYSVASDNTSSEASGTKFNLGTSLSLGFEQEINVPIIGTKIGEVRASVTTDFMSSQGIRNSTEEYESWGLGLGFEQLSLGQVVYEYVANTCYFYNY